MDNQINITGFENALNNGSFGVFDSTAATKEWNRVFEAWQARQLSDEELFAYLRIGPEHRVSEA